MHIGYFKTNLKNVGDDLNPYIWSRLLPNLLKRDSNEVFIGIGSILDDRFDSYAKKIVFGTGARGADSLPKLDNSWDIRFVRGPNTQKAFKAKGLDVKYITDPAVLISEFFSKSSKTPDIGLVPYFRTSHKPWQNIAHSLGYKFISPCMSVERFMHELSSCKLIVTEAMHGAILADSLRIPWIAYTSFTQAHEGDTHEFKWNDWCQSMGLTHQELKLKRFWNDEEETFLNKVKFTIKQNMIKRDILKTVKQGSEMLSDQARFDNVREEILLEVDQINLEV